jgi:hypothetical protein
MNRYLSRKKGASLKRVGYEDGRNLAQRCLTKGDPSRILPKNLIEGFEISGILELRSKSLGSSMAQPCFDCRDFPLELKLRSHHKIVELMQRGMDIPNLLTLDIGEEVRNERISGKGVKIYPWKDKSSPF